MKRQPLHRAATVLLGSLIALLSVGLPTEAQAPPQAQPAAPAPAQPGQTTQNDLSLTVGKTILMNSPVPIERVAVGFGDIVEATAVGAREVLVSAKAPGETNLIIWQQGGNKLLFDVTVHASRVAANNRSEAVRRELEKELPSANVNFTLENDTVFLRGQVKNLTDAQRAVAIASTLGKTVNLLNVDIPPADAQILLKVRFASVDRTASTELGLNLISTGAGGNVGTATTQQFAPPKIERTPNGTTQLTLTDALNIFMLRPEINLGATIRALQRKLLLEILAEPNVLAINGKQASFLAGGEFPFPTLQGGAGGVGQITIQFREFGVRINFLPVITPRGTIRLQVAPEVSALDFSNGLNVQGFQVPALTVRRVSTEVELEAGQSFAIGGLLDNRLTDNLQKMPFLGDIPLFGKLFQSKSTSRQNTELLVIVTPELVRPMPAGQTLPEVRMPKPFLEPNSAVPMRTPGTDSTGPVQARPVESIPMENLIDSLKPGPALTDSRGLAIQQQGGLPMMTSQPQLQPAPAAPAPAPAASPAPK
ncbi:MAG TPA: pilus assembly protein N-terminal domain-containing protein [Bryobacteraceae bacterium]|nr:pilus assembly protein N-terminal domain-containing protein [Bryobacteraceae bacterium]